MTSFTFSPIETTDVSTGTFYLHLINATPTGNETTVSQLILSDAINYAPILLSGLTYTSIKWSFNNISLPTLNYTSPPVGIVVCKRMGVSFANSDPVLYYSSINNALQQNIILTSGKYTLNIKFPVDGLLKFNNYYEFTSGNYVNNETIPKGLVYLVGTRNNTRNFSTLFDNTYQSNYSITILDYTNRNIDNVVAECPQVTYNFGSRKIKVGTFAYYHRDTSALIWELYGSNTIFDISDTISNGSVGWTLLGSSTSSVSGWNFINVNDPTYWQYLKLKKNGTTSGVIQEIEFYNSSIRTTHPNCYSTVLDCPFTENTTDYSGFGSVWTITGTGGIANNALFFDINGYATLAQKNYDSGGRILDLGDRDYVIQFDTKQYMNDL